MICPICEGRKTTMIETLLPDGTVYDCKGKCWKCLGTGVVDREGKG